MAGMSGRRVRVTWRHKGGRKPEGVVIVARGSRWGNPFKVEDYGRADAVRLFTEYAAAKAAAEPAWLEPLSGKDLACYCKLDAECHADVLLGLAVRS